MRRFTHSLLIAALLSASSGVAFAQAISLTLPQAVALAKGQMPQMQGAAAILRAADAGVELARLRPNPTLGIEAENVLGSGRYAGFGGGDKTYSLSVPLELGGKRSARVQVAEAERAAARIGAVTTKADVTLKITQAFIAAVAAQRRVEVAQSGLELAQRAAHVAIERVRAGKASPIEEQRTQVLLVNAQVKLDRTTRAATTTAMALARQLDMASPPSLAAPWFDHADTSPAAASPGELPALAAAQAQVGVANARVDAAQRARVPDVTVSAGMRRLGETGQSAAVLSLSVPLPLFNRSTAELARTRAELERAQVEHRTVAKDTEQAVENAQAELADALAAADAARGPALTAATEAARIARIGYAEGKFSQLELIDAERSLAETRENVIDALSTLHDARARRARLEGSTESLYKE